MPVKVGVGSGHSRIALLAQIADVFQTADMVGAAIDPICFDALRHVLERSALAA